MIKYLIVIMGFLNFFRCAPGTQKPSSTKSSFHGMENLSVEFIALNDNFGKDKEQVFFKNYPLTEADPTSFIALDANYGKDKNAVFYCFDRRESQTYFTTRKGSIIKLDLADPSSFKVLQNGYGMDKNYGYYEGKSFNIKDPESFICIGPFMAKDRFQVYYEDTILEKIDGNSFELINSFYAKDHKNYYIYNYPGLEHSTPRIIANTSDELILLDYPFSKNKQYVFYANQRIDGIDPEHCIILNSSYVKDDQHVFLMGKLIPNADAASFTLSELDNEATNTSSYSLDHNHVFFGLQIIDKADPKSFEFLGYDYGKDKNNVYFKNKPIQNVDLATFKVNNYRTDEGDAIDKNSAFNLGKRMKKN